MPPPLDRELLERERELIERVQPLLAPDERVLATIVHSRPVVARVKQHARRRAVAWTAVVAAVAAGALLAGIVTNRWVALAGLVLAGVMAAGGAYMSLYWYRASKRRAVITDRRMVAWTRWKLRGWLLRSSVESLVFGGGSYVDVRTRPFAGTLVGDVLVRDERGKRVLRLATLDPYHMARVLAEAVHSSTPAPGPVRVFLSYRRDDVAEVGGWLRSELARRVIEVFVDDHDLAPGDVWPQKLEDEVIGSSALVLLVGPGWVEAVARLRDDQDDWVRREIELALQHDVAIVPLLVGGATLPARHDLPPSMAALLDRQATPLPTDSLFTGAVKRLAEALAAIHLSSPAGLPDGRG